jgi:hypothetical protein
MHRAADPAAVAPIFRSSNPPRWATRGWIGELMTLAIVCMLALGLGYLSAGAFAAAHTGPAYLDLGLLVVVLFVSVMIWRKLSARTRARSLDAGVVARAHVPASSPSGGVITATGPEAVSASELPSSHRAA